MATRYLEWKLKVSELDAFICEAGNLVLRVRTLEGILELEDKLGGQLHFARKNDEIDQALKGV